MHDAPIYAQLISERGDIPLQVRNEARRIQRDLEWILNRDPSSGGLLPRPPGAPGPGPRALPPSLPPGNSSTGWLS
ncbi:hypothetical protein FNV62_04930 [Streptomyces sp. RLB3-17]|uniref:hypothetical protein n=1 Tax=Streptomyces mirabilis TaxID=68239 RepID=UPI0006CD7785|nr:hypothetical protein BOG92_006405 [Streptomyces sp. WAC00263]KPI03635.1 hypothetical protein OK006_7449 [Actinobacteria bacterium OK006]QDN55045.1 hypothetical protein FNV67_06460 [Streptomyces sp. S1D4-20]QDN65224.1 hypothetical protein FNV66_06060 [Streptomyces sp. S1D4-14]QDN75597.1 hypothetical protein FNV64_08250 [Streptomyces sp. S1A1-7]QDN85241.1 hypothetical protein FNV61_05845 [Streptomyces sp. RLB3-6]QDN95782.1 hypothetical protein FNV58_06535 [Streptomyces sp. RLB1-9]QDO06090.1